MRIGDTLKKAAGLMFEFDESEAPAANAPTTLDFDALEKELAGKTAAPTPAPAPAAKPKTVEQIVREQPGPNLDEIKAPAAPIEPVIDAAGNIHFHSIYKLAGLTDSPFTAEQVLELLGSLPAELPIEAKRATLKVTLNAMAKTTGVTPETVVADASRKLAALAAYAQSYSEQAGQYVNKAEAEIGNLEAEIARRKQGITEAKEKQLKMVDACQKESDRLDDVLEFFSLDVPPSKYAGQ